MPLTDAFVDERIDAEALLILDITQLYEQMMNTVNYERLIPLVENFLWKRMQRLKHDIHPFGSVRQIIANNLTRFSLDWLVYQAHNSAIMGPPLKID